MTTTTNYSLTKPVNGSNNWGDAVNQNFDTIDNKLKENADGLAAHIAGTADKHGADKIDYNDGTTTRTVQAALRALEEDGSVDTARIADGSITQAKLAAELLTYIQENGGANSEDVEWLINQFIKRGRNQYDYTQYDDPYNRYYSNTTGQSGGGLPARITGIMPVEAGKTYILWLKSKPGLNEPPKWEMLHAYNSEKVKVNCESCGTGDDGITFSYSRLDNNRTYKFTVPEGVHYVATWMYDKEFDDDPDLSYYNDMDEFRKNIMLENSEIKTTFEEYWKTIEIGEMYQKDEVDNLFGEASSEIELLKERTFTDSVQVTKEGANYYVRTVFNDTHDLVQSFMKYTQDLGNYHFNILDTYVIPRGDGLHSISVSNKIKSSGDDTCPNNYNGTYIAGNHGAAIAIEVTVTNHGKTSADAGTEYKDDSDKLFYLIKTYTDNKIYFLSNNISDDDNIWEFNTTLTGNLVNTSDPSDVLVIESKVLSQLRPSIGHQSFKVLIDGVKEITDDGVYEGSYVDFIDVHGILNPAIMLEKIKNNTDPTKIATDADLDDFYRSGEVQVYQEITQRVIGNGCSMLFYNWTINQPIDLGYVGFMQAYPMNILEGEVNLFCYMPKVNAINGHDFSGIINYSSTLSQSFNMPPSTWENPDSAPDRMVQYKTMADNSKTTGFTMGYDPLIGIGKPEQRKNLINDAWYIYSTRKSYPHGIDSKINSLMTQGASYSCACYRHYFDASKIGNATSFYFYEIDGILRVYIDYHTSVSNVVHPLPAKYIGKEITIVEKSPNMAILGDIVSNPGIRVNCTIDGTNTYAYAVLKIS